MIENLFIYFTNILSYSWYFALFGSFIWGILSVLLSPCHMGSIPLIIAFVNGQVKINIKKAFFLSMLFSFGTLISIMLIGIITGLAGKIFGDIGFIGNLIVFIVFILVGFDFLGIFSIFSLLNFEAPKFNNKGFIGSFLLGLMFGVALGPCTFAFMAPVLALVFKSSKNNLLFSMLLILSYAVGHSLVFVLFGTFGELVQKTLNWNKKNNGTVFTKKIIGIIIIVIGLYMFLKNSNLI